MSAPANKAKLLLGQVYNRALDLITKFTAQETPSDQGTDLTGTNGQDVTPKNTAVSEVTTFNRAAYQAALDGFVRSSPATSDITGVPPVLVSFQYILIGGGQIGEGSAVGTGTSSSDANWSLQVNHENENSAGGNLDYILYSIIKYPYGREKPVTDYEFYVPGPNITRAAVIAALNTKFVKTVSDWPSFLPREEHAIVMNSSGELKVNSSVTISASAFANDTSAGSSFSDTEGVGNGINVQEGGREVTIPPTIHGKINLSVSGSGDLVAASSVTVTYNGTPYSATSLDPPITIAAEISALCLPTFDGSSVLTSGALVVGKFYYIVTFVTGDSFTSVGGTNSTGAYFQATGTTPSNWTHGSTLQACLPDWPSSGEFLMGLDTENFEVGYFRVRARTFDFSIQLGA